MLLSVSASKFICCMSQKFGFYKIFRGNCSSQTENCAVASYQEVSAETFIFNLYKSQSYACESVKIRKCVVQRYFTFFNVTENATAINFSLFKST